LGQAPQSLARRPLITFLKGSFTKPTIIYSDY
jgi:hypothetical protein